MSDNAAGTGLTLVNYLKGGIGNQLFQHVFGQSLANKLGASLRYDTSYFAADPYQHKSVLDAFAPGAQTGTVAQLSGPGLYMLREGILHSLQDTLQLPPDARTLALDGYWQDERLLERSVVEATYAAIGRSMQAQRDSAVGQRLLAEAEPTAVHLRRFEYGHMGICKESYYIGAIDTIRQLHPQAKLFVFSDEPNYARALLGARYPELTMVSSGGDLSDLYLMSLCKHFVIANSSYSWWAAYFAEGRGGIIVCPDEWVMMANLVSPCPQRWVRVKDAVRPMQVDDWAAAAVGQEIHLKLHQNAAAACSADLARLELGLAQAGTLAQLGGTPMTTQGGQTLVHGASSAELLAQAQARQLDAFDLLRVDLAGQSFSALDQLIELGLVARSARLQVRFNPHAANAIAWRASIQRKLARTHELRWCHYFNWEEWVRR